MTASGVYEPASSGARSRYPGTAPFSDSPSDRVRFFGRDAEAHQLYLRVLSVPLLVQFGRSGLGKTSLLQAGLFPRLRDRGKAFLPVMVRLNEPGTPLVAAVLRSFEENCAAERLELNAGDTSTLSALLSTTIVWRGDLLLTPVLVFDQFEELFTLHGAAYRDAVAAELGAIATRSEVKVVISLREDYLGALEEFSSAIPGLFQERLRLEAMRESAARDAIVNPARLVAGPGEQPYASPPFELAPEVLDRIIAFLEGSSGVIEPFQLQLLCKRAERLAERRRQGTGEERVTLTVNDFGETAQFEAVLKNFYRETLARVTPRLQRNRAADLCEEGLLGASGHRLMLEERQIRETYGVSNETLATLARERLIVREPRHESVFYEISHDRLAESVFAARRRKMPAKYRRGFWTAALLVVLAFAGLVQWNRTVSSRRQAIQEERDRAESLLSFLLGEDFFGEVRDSGRSTLLAQVQKHVGTGGSTERNTALALRGAAELKIVQGQLTEALALYRRSLKTFEEVGGDVATTRDLARTHKRLAAALETARTFREARRHYDAAEAAWVGVGKSGQATRDDCLEHAETLVWSAFAKHRTGDEALATADLDKSVSIVLEVLFGGNTHCSVSLKTPQPYPPVEALTILSDVAVTRSIQYGTGSDADAAVRLLDEARRQRPASVSIRQQLIDAIITRGNRQLSARSALADVRKGLAEVEELRRWDPENRVWQQARAANQLMVSGAIIRCNVRGEDCGTPPPTLGEAEAIALDTLATLRTLASLDEGNRSLQANMSWGLRTLGDIRAVAGRHHESLRRFQEAETVLRSTRGDEMDEDNALAEAVLLSRIATEYEALGNAGEAAAAMKTSIDVLERLVAAHPGNPSYLRNLGQAYSAQARLCGKRNDTACVAAAEQKIARTGASFDVIVEQWKARYAKRGSEERGEATDLLDSGHPEAALAKLRDAEAALREHLRFDPTRFEWYESIRDTYGVMADAYSELSNDDAYTAALAAQMNAAQMAAWLAPDDHRDDADRELVQARITFAENVRYSSPTQSLAMFQEVIADLERLSTRLPRDPELAVLLGTAKCTAGQVHRETKTPGWEEEVRSGLIDLRRATEIAAGNADAFKSLGLWHVYLAEQIDRDGRNGDVEKEEAIKALRRAVQLASNDEEAHQKLKALGAEP